MSYLQPSCFASAVELPQVHRVMSDVIFRRLDWLNCGLCIACRMKEFEKIMKTNIQNAEVMAKTKSVDDSRAEMEKRGR